MWNLWISEVLLLRDNWDANQVSQFTQGDQVMYFASCSMYETVWDMSLPSAVKARRPYLEWLPSQMSPVLATCWFCFWFEDSLPRPVSPVKQKSQSSILAKLNFFQRKVAFTAQLNTIQTPLLHYVILLRQLIITPRVRWFVKKQMDQLSNISHWESVITLIIPQSF